MAWSEFLGPLYPWPGPPAHARSGFQRLGPEASELAVDRTDWNRQNLASLLAHKACRDRFFAVHKRMAETVPRPGRGSRRWQRRFSAGESGAHRYAGPRRLRHGAREGQRAARLSRNL